MMGGGINLDLTFEWAGYAFALSSIIIFVLFTVTISINRISRRASDPIERAKLLRRMIIGRSAFLVMLILALAILHQITWAQREDNAHECHLSISSNDLYLAKSCVIEMNGNTLYVLARIYSRQNGEMLFESRFETPNFDDPEFSHYLSTDNVIFDDDVVVDLPLSWLDRIHARLFKLISWNFFELFS